MAQSGWVGRSRTFALVVMMLATAAVLTACGDSGGSSATGSAALVTAPVFPLQGCTFTVNNSIPPGEPNGLKPPFPAFSPDPSANAAVKSIEEHGGTALVDGAGVPSGATLYAGPDRSGTVVGTVPSGESILLAEPVIWRTDSDTWFAFFLQCGGPNLYWASLNEIKKVSPAAAQGLTSTLSELKNAPPYSRSHQASLEAVTVKDRSLVWTVSSIMFPVGRGQLIQNVD
ncbi:MAG: hypothetical protein WBG41_05990 [Acidimicrobiales bacterium]